MVPVIENRAEIHGVVASVRADENDPRRHHVTVHVNRVAAVPGFPNLFPAVEGTPLEISIGPGVARPPVVGQPVSMEIRRTGPTTVYGELKSSAEQPPG